MINISGDKYFQELKSIFDLYGAQIDKFIMLFIRNESASNVWNDALITSNGHLIQLCVGTTKPGKPATDTHKIGASWLQYRQHENLWEIKHSNKHGMDVFRQVGAVDTIEDTNRNGKIDPSDHITTDRTNYGMEGHSRRSTSETVGNSSWGCVVWKNMHDFIQVIDLAKHSQQKKFSPLVVPLKQETKYFYEMVM